MAKEKPFMITEDEFREETESYGGYCEGCREFTIAGGIEPDTEGARCPQCNENTVYGAEQALLLGLIAFKNGQDDPDPSEL